LIHYPLIINNRYFENTRIAFREIFKPIGCSYDRLQRALKSGKSELLGYRIERVNQRYALSSPKEPDSDCADLITLPAKTALYKERKRGEPLLRYPYGESPLYRGIQHQV